MDFKKLKQTTIEDRYSKKNIRNAIMMDIEDSMVDMLPMYNVAVREVGKYLSGKYYASKQTRIEHLRTVFTCPQDIRDLVTEILIAIMPITGAQPIQGACGQVSKLLGMEVFDGVKTAAELITVICESDLYDLIPANQSETGSILVVSNYELSDSCKKYILDTKYLPPMICKPNHITKNRDSARITIKESMILGDKNHHNGKIALDVLNISNGIKMSLDERMLAIEEASSKPLDTPEKKKNFRMMKEASAEVYQDILDGGNEFWNTHKYDMRGREYSQGYYVHMQGSSYKKSLINLHKKEVITL